MQLPATLENVKLNFLLFYFNCPVRKSTISHIQVAACSEDDWARASDPASEQIEPNVDETMIGMTNNGYSFPQRSYHKDKTDV